MSQARGHFVRLALVALSSLLAWYAYAADAWPLAFFCWLPLLLAIDGQSPRNSFLLGLFAGLITQAFQYSWLFSVARSYTGWNPAFIAIAMAVLFALQAGQSAVTCWIAARANVSGWPLALVFPFALAAGELAYPRWIDWFGALQVHNAPSLMQTAELGGPVLVSLLLAFSSAALFELVRAYRVAWRRVQIAALYAMPVMAMVAYGSLRVRQLERVVQDAPVARIGVVQASLSHDGKSERLPVLSQMTRDLMVQGDADLIVWPESAVDRYHLKRGSEGTRALEKHILQEMQGSEFDSKRAVPLLFGAPLVEGRIGATFSSNAAVLWDPASHGMSIYRKMRLFPFGEHVPQWIAPLIGPREPLTAGTKFTPLKIGDRKVTPLICYEDTEPTFANDAVRAGTPDLLVGLTNDAWFERSFVTEAHLACAKFRAVEHRRYFVRAGETGPSSVIDPMGRVVMTQPAFTRGSFIAEARWINTSTPYEWLGDKPLWGASAIAIFLGFVPRARLKRRRRLASN